MNIIPLFCEIDDFFQVYEKQIEQRQLPIPDQPKKPSLDMRTLLK